MAETHASLLRQKLKHHEELERIARASPGTLRRRIVLYALAMLTLPVLFIFGCIFLAAAGLWVGYAVVSVDVMLLVLPLLMLLAAGSGVYLALNGLTAPMQERPMRRLVRADYPRLFDFVEEVRQEAGGPPVDHIVVAPILNAAVREEWRSLLSRRAQHTLIIGLDLMELLSLEEFRSTLAHEMGHLAARDTYYNTWASRMLLCWSHILESGRPGQAKRNLLIKLYSRFHGRYSMLHSAVSRQAEIRADQIEASVTSPAIAARSLMRIEVYSTVLGLHEGRRRLLLNRSEPVPPTDIYERRLEFLRSALPVEVEEEARRIACIAETTFDATHPALRPRLAELGITDPDSVPLDPVDERSTTLLGDKHEDLVKAMAQRHRQETIGQWQETFRVARREAVELKDIREKQEEGELTVDNEWCMCEIETSMADYDEVLPRLDRFVEGHPSHPRGRFLRGLHLLARRREEGIPDVEFGMSCEPALRPQGFAALGDFLLRQGRYEEMLQIAERVDAFGKERELAEKERAALSAAVPMSRHRLTPGKIDMLTSAARTHPRVRAAHVVRVETKSLSEEDFHVIVVEVRKEKGLDDASIRYHISRELDFPHRVVVVPGDKGKWLEKAGELPESRVYCAGDGEG